MAFTLPMNQQQGVYWNNGQQQMVTPVGGQIQQPMMPQLSQQMAPQTTQEPSYLPGKIVRDETEILAKDVPADGSVAVFIMQDLSKIIARQVNVRGTIDELTYVVERAPETKVPENDILPVIMARLDNIEGMLKKNIYKGGNKKPPYKKPVKEESNGNDAN